MKESRKRLHCACIKSMELVIGKEIDYLYERGKTYLYVCSSDEFHFTYYKVYGKEFDLTCTQDEFDEHFIILHNKNKKND